MSKFNAYFMNDFVACRLLAYARDVYRNRDVRIYQVPGEWDFVGVTDGVDKWIAPISANPFSVNVGRLLEDIKAGKPNPKPTQPTVGGRRKLLTTEAQPITSRRILLITPRKRHALHT